jgi:hypothetical protein
MLLTLAGQLVRKLGNRCDALRLHPIRDLVDRPYSLLFHLAHELVDHRELLSG